MSSKRLSPKAVVGVALFAIVALWIGYLFWNADGRPMGAVELDGHYFFVYAEALSWQEAKERCESLGGRLAVIPNQKTQELLVKLAAGDRVWLGAQKLKSTETWTWVDGSPLLFQSWDARQPDNFRGRERFLMMSSNGGMWNDAWEERHANSMGMAVVGFVCEWPNESENEVGEGTVE